MSSDDGDFQYAEEPFLKTLKVTLDDRYTPQMDAIYVILAKYIIQTLIEGYNRPWGRPTAPMV